MFFLFLFVKLPIKKRNNSWYTNQLFGTYQSQLANHQHLLFLFVSVWWLKLAHFKSPHLGGLHGLGLRQAAAEVRLDHLKNKNGFEPMVFWRVLNQSFGRFFWMYFDWFLLVWCILFDFANKLGEHVFFWRFLGLTFFLILHESTRELCFFFGSMFYFYLIVFSSETTFLLGAWHVCFYLFHNTAFFKKQVWFLWSEGVLSNLWGNHSSEQLIVGLS